MAQVDISCVTGRVCDRSGRRRQWCLNSVHAVDSEWAQKRGHDPVRTRHDSCRGITGIDIGQEAEQEKSALARLVVDTPTSVGCLEAGIDVPSGVARVNRGGKPDDEQTEVRAWQPAVGVEELVNRFQHVRTICSLSQRFTGYQAAYDRVTPAHFVVQINVKLRGGEVAALSGKVFRECGAQMDEPPPPDGSRVRSARIFQSANAAPTPSSDPSPASPSGSARPTPSSPSPCSTSADSAHDYLDEPELESLTRQSTARQACEPRPAPPRLPGPARR